MVYTFDIVVAKNNSSSYNKIDKTGLFWWRFVSKDKILNIRIDPELKKAAKKVAESDHRSLSNWVTWLIQREVKRSGKKTR